MFYTLIRPPLNQVNLAKAWLDQAFLQTPSDPEPWVIIGEFALQEKRLPEAEIDFAKADQLLKTYTNEAHKPMIQQAAFSGMVSVAESRQRWAQAQQRLEDFLKKCARRFDRPPAAGPRCFSRRRWMTLMRN